MGDHVVGAIVTIVMGIIGVATLAVLFSTKANTSQVIGAAGSALGTDLLAAVSPITGTAPQISSQF